MAGGGFPGAEVLTAAMGTGIGGASSSPKFSRSVQPDLHFGRRTSMASIIVLLALVAAIVFIGLRGRRRPSPHEREDALPPVPPQDDDTSRREAEQAPPRRPSRPEEKNALRPAPPRGADARHRQSKKRPARRPEKRTAQVASNMCSDCGSAPAMPGEKKCYDCAGR